MIVPAANIEDKKLLKLKERGCQGFGNLPTQFLKQFQGVLSPPGVRSTYIFTKGIFFFENCDFGAYPIASACVKDCGTLGRSEPQTLQK